MLGTIIKHPQSTNFYENDNTPPLKKLKRVKSTDTCNSDATSDDGTFQSDSPRPIPLESPDSEEDFDTDEEQEQKPLHHQTDLESALPTVKTDKEAIAEYETRRAAEINESLQRESRLDKSKWVRGKSSIYLDAFHLALETVLGDEGHLFDEKEMEVFKVWRDLDYEAQYL
jgi:Fanconi-associated nuclease 1